MLPQVVAQELEQEVLLQVVAVALAELVVLLQVVVVVLVELLQVVVVVLGEPLQESAQELEECLLRKDLMNLLSHLIFS